MKHEHEREHKMGGKMGKGHFGKSGGGSEGFRNKVIDSPMSGKMVPKGGKVGKKG